MVEVSLALGVAGFCLLSVFGLLPVGLACNMASMDQTLAGNIASAVVSDLRSAQPLGAAMTPRYGLPVPAAGSPSTMHTIYIGADGSATAVDNAPVGSGGSLSRYRATIFFYPPSDSQGGGLRGATAVRVLITWPALADSAAQNAPSNFTGSYEAQTTLDRN